MKALIRTMWALGLVTLLVGCPSETAPGGGADDAGTTPSTDEGGGSADVEQPGEDVDTGADVDSGADADTGPDTAPDVSEDAGPDAAPDAELDVAPDAELDVAPDVELDVAPDAELDVAPDAELDVAPDAEPDVDPSDTNIADVDPADVDPGDVDPADVDPGDVDPGDVDLTDVDPGDAGAGDPDVALPDVSDAGVDGLDAGPDAGPDVISPSDGEVWTLFFLNHPTTTKAVLTAQVGLTGSAPGAIIDFRAGDDTVLNTDDDQVIDALEGLDALSGVGQATITKLTAFARNWRPEVTDPLLVALNADDLTAIGLETDAEISSSAAASIIMYRGGDDLSVGTDDDRYFAARKEVDDLSGVGPATLAALEAWAGLGATEVLSTETSANLVAVAFGPLGEALVVGSPVGGTAHVLWYTPFSEDATVGEDPYVFLPLEGVAEAMNAAAFAPQGDIAVVAGEADGLYVFDTFEKTFEFVEIAGVAGFTDVTFDAQGTVVFGATVEAGIKAYDTATGTVSDISDDNMLALATGLSGHRFVMAGPNGAVVVVADDDSRIELPNQTGEDVFSLLGLTDTYFAAGSDGFAGTWGDGLWDRIPTRTLEGIRAAAVNGDGQILMAGTDGVLLRYTPASAEVAPLTPAISADLWGVGFADDGTALIVGANGVALRYTPPAP